MSPSHLPTDVDAEFYLDGAWVDTYSGVDLTARIRGADRVRIARGLVDQQSSTSPTTCNFTLNNRDNLFTNDHPNSPLYGKIGLNTPLRLGVKASDGTWESYLRMPDTATETDIDNYCSTADKASLDITSDIDVRAEVTSWYTRDAPEQCLVSKYLTTGNQRSWAIMMQPDGSMHFVHSTTGSDINVTVGSGVLIPEASRRCAFRVTVDVNDGAGNRVFRFYSSDSNTIAGPWTLTATGTFAGVFTFFSGSAPLEVGSGSGGGGIFAGGATPWRGKIHALEVYSGIAGTKVADFKPATKAPELTTWADACASPNTWTLTGSYVRLASDRIRAAVELSSMADTWDATGRDVQVPVNASGLLQRYSGTKSAIGSAIYRYNRLQTGTTGLWPLESSSWTPLPRGLTGVFSGVTTGSTTGLDGSSGAATMTTSPTSSIRLVSSVSGPGTGTASFLFYFNLAGLAASDKLFATAYATSGATASQWDFYVSNIGFRFDAYASDGSLLDTGSSLFGTGASPLDQWVAMSVQLTTETTNVRWQTQWHAVGTEIFYTHNTGGDTYVGTVGQFYSLNFYTTDAAFAGAQVAHAKFTTTGDLINSTTGPVSTGWSGEAPGRRMQRLSLEESFAFEWLGDLDTGAMCGPQSADTLYANLLAAAKVDGGILSEIRDKLGALFVSRNFLGNRTGLTLDYQSSHLDDTPGPINDNRNVVNDFTASRPGGGSARSEVTDKYLKNVSDPPVGAGRYERTDSFNVADDTELAGQAQKQTAVGSWPERRVPNLSIGLHRTEITSTTLLLDKCLALDLGHPITLTGLSGTPAPPNDMLLTLFGYTETFHGFEWTIFGNTVPAGPYQVPVLGGYITTQVPRLDVTDNSHTVLNASITSTVTGAAALVLKTDASGTYPTKFWVDGTSYASDIGGGVTIDVDIEGEIVTLSAIGAPSLSGGFNRQTCTVSARSVNGIIKAHSAGAPVRLAHAYYLGEI